MSFFRLKVRSTLGLTGGVTLNCEGAVATVVTVLLTTALSMLPVKLNGGETLKIEFSYVVPVDVTLPMVEV